MACMFHAGFLFGEVQGSARMGCPWLSPRRVSAHVVLP
jgi:hypothetical protein